ncbi:MAG: alpha/beta hydrolase [Oscillospiraceae bacterium]|nr:alpha/beta hydrolase [Oscillospiraceae bacterium]
MPKKQKHKHPAPGQMVKVNGREMHVFTQGAGNYTYVFLSGSGTRYPTTDFKPLWSFLAVNDKIAVVEKAGYGWSDVSDNAPRDIETLLRENREALCQAKIHPPYILVPHSVSGLEALYWAQTYPDEVLAIIGLDMAFPEYYDYTKFPMQLIRFMAFLGALTPDMLNEAKCVKENARKVNDRLLPLDIPILSFISDGKFARAAKMNWSDMHKAHVAKFQTGNYKQLECGHYVHRFKAEEIAAEIKQFVTTL